MPTRAQRRAAWCAAILLPIVAVALVILPLWLDQPFSKQTAAIMAAVFRLRAWAPALTLLAALGTLGAAAWLWRGRGILARALLILLAAIPAGATWLARQNPFEWMFNPVRAARYASLDEASAFVADDDMVMVVSLEGETAAYPVRQLAYHHIAMDVVGGVPIVVTY
jgi:hypothetical protein